MKYQLIPVNAVRCPVCKSDTGTTLYSVNSEQAAQHFVRSELDPARHDKLKNEIERLWSGREARVIRCGQCEFCFSDPYAAGSAEFYATLLNAPSFPQWKWEFQITLETVQQLAAENKNLTLLELGAGDGAFVRRSSPTPIQKDHILCTEYSAAGAEAIRQLGIACEMIDARALAAKDSCRTFDIICLFQVLEHLDSLDALWEAFNVLSHPGSHLFISVPNNRFIEFCETHGGLLDMPPNHIGRWNPKAFEMIGSSHGWRIVRHETEPAVFLKIVRSFAENRYFRHRSVPGSIANRTTLIQNRNLRRAFGLADVRFRLSGRSPDDLNEPRG